MRISVLGLILMFLFPITLFAQQRVDVTGKTLVVSNNGEGQEVLPYTNILVLEAGDSTLVKGVMSDAGGNFRLSFHAKKESPYLLKVSYIGMKPEFRALNTGKTKIHVGNIVLTEGLELSEVVVTAPIKEVELVTDRQILEAVLAEVKGLVTRMDRMEEHQERFEEETRNNFANLRRHLENVTDRNISLLAESHLSLINQMDRSTVWMNKMLVDEFKLNSLTDRIAQLERRHS